MEDRRPHFPLCSDTVFQIQRGLVICFSVPEKSVLIFSFFIFSFPKKADSVSKTQGQSASSARCASPFDFPFRLNLPQSFFMNRILKRKSQRRLSSKVLLWQKTIPFRANLSFRSRASTPLRQARRSPSSPTKTLPPRRTSYAAAIVYRARI